MLFIGILVASIVWGSAAPAAKVGGSPRQFCHLRGAPTDSTGAGMNGHGESAVMSPPSIGGHSGFNKIRVKNRITMIILWYSLMLSWNSIALDQIGSGIGIYSGLWQVTSVTACTDLLLFFVAAITVMLTEVWPSNKVGSPGGFAMGGSRSVTTSAGSSSYTLIILFTTLGMTSLISSYDLVSFFLGIELQSFGLYILATIYRESESSTSSGLKYFLLGALSSGFLLLGSSLIYGVTGVTNWDSFYQITSVACSVAGSAAEPLVWGDSTGMVLSGAAAHPDFSPLSSSNWVRGGLVMKLELSLLIIGVGLLFKIAAAPFHNWAPDVYDGVPTLVTSWLAVIPKISLLVFMLELFAGVFWNLQYWSLLFLISALLSQVVGSVVGLGQYRIKRLLAYSAISHVGFMLLGLGINTEQSIESMMFYLIQYSLTSINIFYILLALGNLLESAQPDVPKYSPLNTISQLKGQFQTAGGNPLLALCLAISFFSIAGIPPFIGFFAKLKVFYAATHSGYYMLAIIAVLTSVISAAYYLRVIKVISFDGGALPGSPNVAASHRPPSGAASAAVGGSPAEAGPSAGGPSGRVPLPGGAPDPAKAGGAASYTIPYGISWVIALLTLTIVFSPVLLATLKPAFIAFI